MRFGAAQFRSFPTVFRAVFTSFTQAQLTKSLNKASSRREEWRLYGGAAVEAIAVRGDTSRLPHVVDKFTGKNPKVRYSAGAAVIRLSANEVPQDGDGWQIMVACG